MSEWVTVYRVEIDHGAGWERAPLWLPRRFRDGAAEQEDSKETVNEDTAYWLADRMREQHPGSGVRVVEESRVVADGAVSVVGEDVTEL